MERVYKATQISEHVYWVGAVDWTIRDFHGYRTGRGSTYNAYLICSDSITLVDTVKAPFVDEMLARISSVVDPERIECIISNHAEMDHSGGLPRVAELVRPAKIIASTMGKKALGHHFGIGDSVTPLGSGEAVDLGSLRAEFLETRMLHWPDSMFTYLPADELLFSQDAFGMHLASNERFNDEVEPSVLAFEAATYYANILLPYSKLVGNLVEAVKGRQWRLQVIAPDHGPVWRTDIEWIIDRYATWSRQARTRKAVILYDTMWKSTENMARVIGEGVASRGCSVRLMRAGDVHRSDVAYELLDAAALVAGSPTLNNHLFPTMADILTYLAGLKPVNVIGAAFGSYGWSGEAVSQVDAMLSAMGVEQVAEPVNVRYVPDADALSACFALGCRVGDEIMRRYGQACETSG